MPYQQRWINDAARIKLWVASRQIGKSFTIALETVTEALEKRCNSLIVSASERQSKEVMEKVFSHLRYLKVRTQDIIKAERETKEEVRLPNGSRILSLPASPNTVRGFSGHVFLDEFALHRDSREIWQALFPTITRGYRLRITSTPKGKQNMFYDLYAHGKEISIHETDIYKAVEEGLSVSIDELRANAGDPDTWAQEYECAFLDEATAYITYEMIASCESEKTLWSDIKTVLPHMPHSDMYLGVDIGRKRDLTVMWICEKLGDVFWARHIRCLEKAPFRVQREELFDLIPYCRRTCIDATGLGMQLAEECQERFGTYAVEPVTFTQPVKEDLAVTLRRRFEDREVRIPVDREIREDIHSVKKTTTSAGNIRFDAERNESGHADRFWALALAVHAGSAPSVFPQVRSAGTRQMGRDLDGYHGSVRYAAY